MASQYTKTGGKIMACKGCGPGKGRSRKGEVRKFELTADGRKMEVLNVFNLGSLQDFLNFKLLCKQNKITDAQVRKYIEARYAKLEGRAIESENDVSLDNLVTEMNRVPACPKCGQSVEFERVNTMACNQVGGKYKFMMQCMNVMGCGWEYYSRSKNAVDFIRKNRKIIKSKIVTVEKLKEF